jgi:hypothetical protein
MTRVELLARVRQQTLISSTELTDAAVNALLLEGLYDIAGRYPRWPWAFTSGSIDIAAATSSYALPATLIQLESVAHTGLGATPLVLTSKEAVLRQYGEVPGSGLPTRYYQSGQNIVFVPTPDNSAQNVSITYFAFPASTTFDADTELPPFAVAFHQILADYAIATIWEREELEEKAQYYWARYFDGVERMAKFYQIQLPAISLIVGGGYLQDRLLPWRNYLGA